MRNSPPFQGGVPEGGGGRYMTQINNITTLKKV